MDGSYGRTKFFQNKFILRRFGVPTFADSMKIAITSIKKAFKNSRNIS